MTLELHPWEGSLLSLAQEAWHSVIPAPLSTQDDTLLERAYAHCKAVTATCSRSFYLASNLLPADKRRAVHAGRASPLCLLSHG
jgi:hypothetical protein